MNYNKWLDSVTRLFIPRKTKLENKRFDMAKDQLAEFIPGMEASVELVGEKRSIAQYLTSPFKKMSSEAFREK